MPTQRFSSLRPVVASFFRWQALFKKSNLGETQQKQESGPRSPHAHTGCVLCPELPLRDLTSSPHPLFTKGTVNPVTQHALGSQRVTKFLEATAVKNGQVEVQQLASEQHWLSPTDTSCLHLRVTTWCQDKPHTARCRGAPSQARKQSRKTHHYSPLNPARCPTPPGHPQAVPSAPRGNLARSSHPSDAAPASLLGRGRSDPLS